MIGLLSACAVLLAVAGAAKVLRPAPTERAAAALDLAVADRFTTATTVRLLGLLEVAVAFAVLFVGGALAAAALAVSFLLLTAVAARLVRVAPGSDCGCFGTAREPVSRLHIAVNGLCTLVAAVAIVLPQPSLPAALATAGVVLGAAIVVLVGVLAALLGALMTALPALVSARAKVVSPR